MFLALLVAYGLAGPARAQRPSSNPRRPLPGSASSGGWRGAASEPRNAVLVALALVVLIGGGRRLLLAWRARDAVGRLNPEGPVSLDAIRAAAEHGRAGVFDLFRLLGEGENETTRRAAGSALSVLWARDELIPEEEKAIVRRGFSAEWRARKRYPRQIRAEIPVAVAFGVPFLEESGGGVRPSQLEWSYRVTGARRASLEAFSPWAPGSGRADFTLVPSDFDTDGPHRLVFQARVRTVGLTSPWELELPHMPMTFEFDPRLEVHSLLALPDAGRAEEVARRVALTPVLDEEERPEAVSFLPLTKDLALRRPPVLTVTLPLPHDLAHAIQLEVEGVSGRFPAGEILTAADPTGGGGEGSTRSFPLRLEAPLPEGSIDRAGRRRVRAHLTADPDRGWADPGLRSVWPGSLTTDWVECEVVRR